VPVLMPNAVAASGRDRHGGFRRCLHDDHRLPRRAGASFCSHDAKDVEIEEQPLNGVPAYLLSQRDRSPRLDLLAIISQTPRAVPPYFIQSANLDFSLINR
jgi:hypothetical protein